MRLLVEVALTATFLGGFLLGVVVGVALKAVDQ